MEQSGTGGGRLEGENQEDAAKNCASPAFQQQTQAFALPESWVSLCCP